jgi:hypothetical protein
VDVDSWEQVLEKIRLAHVVKRLVANHEGLGGISSPLPAMLAQPEVTLAGGHAIEPPGGELLVDAPSLPESIEDA